MLPKSLSASDGVNKYSEVLVIAMHLILYVKKTILILLPTCWLISCTAQNFVPIRPLQKGENEIRWSLNYSLNKFDFGSIQLSAFHGISNSDVVGASFTGFIIPCSFSYAHYWLGPTNVLNVQFHLNDILSTNYNPSYEFDFGFSTISEKTFNSFKAGVGYYDTPLLRKLFGQSIVEGKFVPIFGYSFQHNEFNIDFQLIYGMTNYFVKYYKERLYLNSQDIDSASFATKETEQEFLHNDIKAIIQDNELYKVAFNSGDTLLIANQDPYADCYVCGAQQRTYQAYLASDDNSVYWIYWKNHVERNKSPIMLELNMKKILHDFNLGDNLKLFEESDITLKTITRNNSFFNDLFFSIGNTNRYNKK